MITLLTCTGDRHVAFALCEKWMNAQTVRWDQWLVLDDSEKPTTATLNQDYYYWPELRGKGSMVNKVKRALERNLIKGDILIVIEDDDFYAPDYIEWCASALKQFDLVGECNNLYYNVRYRWWFEHGNRTHASLCATSMRRSVFPALLAECQNPNDPFIDSRLWANCRLPKMAFSPGLKHRSVGIKSMPGTKGYGSGHDRTSGWANYDPGMDKLRTLIGRDADAYESFHEKPLTIDGLPQIEVHLVTFNEEMILPYTLRHYQTFASRIIVHDGGSTDRTKAICGEFDVEFTHWDTGGKINDVLLRELKERAWMGTNADWVIMADADELIYFPHGVEQALLAYESVALAIVKPHGFEMMSDSLPAGTGQIYDEIKHGGIDDRWYAKPIMFSPRRVMEIHYSAGAHECTAILRGGMGMMNPVRFSEPPCYLLHYHHVGPVEMIGAKYDANKSRFSEENKKHGWGWHGDGRQHAMDKRAQISKTITQVIP